MLYIDFEDLAGGRPFHGHGRSHTLRVKACYQRSAPPAVPRGLEEGALTDGGIGVDGSKGAVHEASTTVRERAPDSDVCGTIRSKSDNKQEPPKAISARGPENLRIPFPSGNHPVVTPIPFTYQLILACSVWRSAAVSATPLYKAT